MDYIKKVEEILDILVNDKDSKIYKFLNCTPKNDAEYMNLWIDYITYVYIDEDIGEILLHNANQDDFFFKHHYRKQIEAMFTKHLNKVMNNLSFQPRLEKYLEKYTGDEKILVRKIILIFCHYSISSSVYSNETLISLGRKMNIPDQQIFSLDSDHELFKDKLIELQQNPMESDAASFCRKDLVRNMSIFSIFADLPVSEEELMAFEKTPVLELFDIKRDFLLSDNQGIHEDNISKEEENDDDTDFNLEQYFYESDIKTGDDLVISESEYDETELKPYKNDLEYLYEEGMLYDTLIKIREIDSDEDQKQFNLLTTRARQQKAACAIRLSKSIKAGFTPRLEKFCKKLKLSGIEKKVLLALTINNIFITKDTIDSDPTVAEILYALLESPFDMIKMKKIFHKNEKLVKYNLIQLSSNYDIVEKINGCDVMIDSRLVEYFIGENFDITDYIEGSFLYKSKISFDDVILPKETKNKIISNINGFHLVAEEKKRLEFCKSVSESGNALTLLFLGPSGTGKTMLANALANYLDKKILVSNFNDASRSLSQTSDDRIFSLLFREARMNKAVLFFDESESLLEKRTNTLLTEIQNHDGIVIFATNALSEINEAMRRRINLIAELMDPGPLLRKKIWQIHLPKDIKLDKDVDLDTLSRRYEINGGLIKNAVFSALTQAVNETRSKDPVWKMAHLEYGAKEQLKNRLFMSNLQHHKIPDMGLDKVILPENQKKTINEIISIEKAGKVLDGEWDFHKTFGSRNGIAVLFHGPSGTGKTLTAEAVAYETGKTIKLVNYAQIVSMWAGNTEKALETLFKEVADNNSILLFDEADAVFAPRAVIHDSSDRHSNRQTDVLLSLIEQYDTFAILTSNFIENIDTAFFRRFRYIIEFQIPTSKLRLRLWNTLIPPKLPLDKDVNLEMLANKYSFTGGEIRNAIYRAATSLAVSFEKNRKINMQELIRICNELQQSYGNKQKAIGF